MLRHPTRMAPPRREGARRHAEFTRRGPPRAGSSEPAGYRRVAEDRGDHDGLLRRHVPQGLCARLRVEERVCPRRVRTELPAAHAARAVGRRAPMTEKRFVPVKPPANRPPPSPSAPAPSFATPRPSPASATATTLVRCSAPDGSRPLFHLEPSPESDDAKAAALETAQDISKNFGRGDSERRRSERRDRGESPAPARPCPRGSVAGWTNGTAAGSPPSAPTALGSRPTWSRSSGRSAWWT